ncbi:complex I assembly factor TIMMDC1, mitochondrial isoform X1 [Eublepharis macularius]|uniref:Complex I assembly factor TIMMDC1, mitochondrial n=1 Tax=Eublepharis macularius TaxID=481883 RepID=A0AA97J1Y3_EUBMA|nr:complex I assembly factor TIMMDC1, mitochondrial isoform X1 [Eublepharis macularius]
MEPPPGPAASSAVFGGQPGSKPWFAGRPQPPESGWERILELFRKDELNRYPEETVSICKATFTAGVVGFVYGGIPGFVYAKERYIEQSGAEMYHSRLDAAQSAHRAAVRGFIRYGWRWSWRIAAFVAIFNTVSTSLSAYRDKNSLSNFVAAGAFTGGLFRFHLGLGGFAAGSIFGALLGVPAGGLMMAMQNLSGETLHEGRKQERRERYEQQLIEWNNSLGITEKISKEIDDYIQEGAEKRHDEKIQK